MFVEIDPQKQKLKPIVWLLAKIREEPTEPLASRLLQKYRLTCEVGAVATALSGHSYVGLRRHKLYLQSGQQATATRWFYESGYESQLVAVVNFLASLPPDSRSS